MGLEFCILRAPGTNCDIETRHAVIKAGADADIVHINQLARGKKTLPAYDGLIIPGGFSYGDHIRSGAIMGKILGEKFGSHVSKFAAEGKPVLGICNGFQVLVESGLLPGLDGVGKTQIALGKNISSKYECRWVYLKAEAKSRCIFTRGVKTLLRMPVAHGEGRVILPAGEEAQYLKKLESQIALRYATESGSYADKKYPYNPNGSIADIAGICNSDGNVFGLMPHPERALYRATYPDWTRHSGEGFGDGFLIFKNMVEYAEKVF